MVNHFISLSGVFRTRIIRNTCEIDIRTNLSLMLLRLLRCNMLTACTVTQHETTMYDKEYEISLKSILFSNVVF